MSPRVRYRGASSVDVRVDSAAIGLATHAETQQGYLSATLDRVDVVRDALRAAHAMAWPQASVDGAGAARDLWFSVFDDAVFVEVPAPDGRAWLRVRLARTLFPVARDVATGTTTLRLPSSLGRELRRLSSARATSFVVSPGGADPAIDGSILDDRVTFAAAPAWTTAVWLAGRARPSPSAAKVPTTTLHPAALVRPLAAVAGADLDAPLAIDADPPCRAAPLVVRCGARLRAVAPLLAHVRRVSFDVEAGTCSLVGDDVAATVALACSEAEGRHDAPLVGETAAEAELRAGRAFVDVDGALRSRPLEVPDAR